MKIIVLMAYSISFFNSLFYLFPKTYPIDMTALTANLYTYTSKTNKKIFEEKLYIYNPDRLVLVNYTDLSDKEVVVITEKDYFIQRKYLLYKNENYYILSLNVLARAKNTLTLNIDGTKYDGTVLNDSIGSIGVIDDNLDVLLSVKKGKYVYTKIIKQYY